MLPAFTLYAVFFLVPFGRTLYYSFFAWNGMGKPKFLGIENYVRLAEDDLFTTGIVRVLIWAAASIILKVGAALILAALLRKRIKGSEFYTSIFFMPVVISAAAISLMFALLYDLDTGPINILLRAIGMGNLARNWLGDEATAFWAVIAVPIFHTIGYFFVILLAGMHDIPEDIYEVAEIDGAGPLKQFTSITLPLISPILGVCTVLATTGAIKSFDYVFILTAGGPGTATQVPATYMYQTIFVGLKYGYGTALAITIFIFSLLITLILRRVTSYQVG
jgi:raffinose/stachyose/melibiose transport system permease protein